MKPDREELDLLKQVDAHLAGNDVVVGMRAHCSRDAGDGTHDRSDTEQGRQVRSVRAIGDPTNRAVAARDS